MHFKKLYERIVGKMLIYFALSFNCKECMLYIASILFSIRILEE